MSKSQMKQTFALIRKPGESFGDYHKAEVKSCREQLSYAMKNAAKDHDGRPIFTSSAVMSRARG